MRLNPLLDHLEAELLEASMIFAMPSRWCLR
jgi:hypothetical protein